MPEPGPVLLAIGGLHGGGAERVVLDLAAHWPTDGPSPKILLGRQQGALMDAVPAEVEVVTLGVPPTLKNTRAFAAALGRVIAHHKPSAVISHMTPMNRMMLRLRALGALDLSLTVTEHNNPTLNSPSSGLSAVASRAESALLYRRADALVCVSQGLLDSVRSRFRLPPGLGEVIHNPVDVPAIRSKARRRPDDPLSRRIAELRRPLYLAAGRLHPQKDFATLINAFHSIDPERRGSLLILGEGEQRSALEAQVGRLGLADRVLLPGFVLNPWWYMAEADLFVLSSRWEGFGNVLVEAMAVGTPFVATDCAYGPGEIAEIFGSGTLIPVGDVRALAGAMASALVSADVITPPREGAFEYVDPKRVAEAYARTTNYSAKMIAPEDGVEETML